MATTSGDVTKLLQAVQDGNPEAANELIPLVYNELRRIAGRYMKGERSGHTLQATALVDEAYLRLIRWDGASWQCRAHFFGIAARIMRRLLIDHALKRKSQKHGGEHEHVPLDDVIGKIEFTLTFDSDPERLLALDAALEHLAKIDERQSRVVELRFFGGLTIEETAEVLGVATRTVKRDWEVARAWLYLELNGECDPDQ